MQYDYINPSLYGIKQYLYYKNTYFVTPLT